jgi:signal transduction histidine kinase
MFPPASGVTKVRAIACDTARREMWFAMQQGIARWDGQTVTRFGEESGAPASDVTSLLIDRSQTVWAGTATGAVFRGRGGRFDRLGSDASLEGSYVSSLQEVRSTREAGIWITTLGAGLFRWTESSGFMRFSLEEGLPERRLTWVIDGPGDRLWLGSLSGILGVHRHDLHRPRAPRSSEPQWLLLDRADGMLSRECTGGFHPAGALGPAGQIWFPTVKGVVELRPVAVRWDATPPSVVIEECRAGGRALDLTEPIVVGPGRKRLEFRYTALELGAPGKARFRVRLAGLESEESDPRSDRTASYEAVPPGRYRFVVRAANGDGVWTSGGASLAVEVLPHFWETRWFRASVAAVAVAGAAGIGWFAAHLRMRRKLTRLELQSAREQERARIAQDLHDDLGASLTELSLLAHLAAEAPSAPREPLPEIAEKAQALAGALDEIVWAVNPRHDTLASLADYVAAFAAEFLKTAGIGLRLDFPREMPRLMIDSERRHSLFLAVREALNNVVKHSRAREVLVRFALEDGWLRIMVHDDGRGIAHGDEGGLGEGLRGMQERLVRCGGTCRVESAAGKGTTVHFSLPV